MNFSKLNIFMTTQKTIISNNIKTIIKITVSKTPKINTPVAWEMSIPNIGATIIMDTPWADLLFFKYCELPITNNIDNKTSSGEIKIVTNNHVILGRIICLKYLQPTVLTTNI